jgi:hypothetical protein
MTQNTKHIEPNPTPCSAPDSMPNVAASPLAQSKTVSSSLGIPRLSSSETHLQECRNSGVSQSPTRQAKRQPATAMAESEDENPLVYSNRTIIRHKRQKIGRIRTIDTHEEAVSTATRGSKIFQHLQEQRARLPIAQGWFIYECTLECRGFCLFYFIMQGARHSCAVSQ